jgi:hypothetical protein
MYAPRSVAKDLKQATTDQSLSVQGQVWKKWDPKTNFYKQNVYDPSDKRLAMSTRFDGHRGPRHGPDHRCRRVSGHGGKTWRFPSAQLGSERKQQMVSGSQHEQRSSEERSGITYDKTKTAWIPATNNQK